MTTIAYITEQPPMAAICEADIEPLEADDTRLGADKDDQSLEHTTGNVMTQENWTPIARPPRSNGEMPARKSPTRAAITKQIDV